MTHKVNAHLVHYIIPAIKDHVSVSSFISAIKKTSSFTMDILYCLMGIIEGRICMFVCITVCVCLCHFRCLCVYTCEFVCTCMFCVYVYDCVGVSLFQDYVSWHLHVAAPGQCLLFIKATNTGKSQLDVIWNCTQDIIFLLELAIQEKSLTLHYSRWQTLKIITELMIYVFTVYSRNGWFLIETSGNAYNNQVPVDRNLELLVEQLNKLRIYVVGVQEVKWFRLQLLSVWRHQKKFFLKRSRGYEMQGN